jgi:hypothetical protein
MSDIFTKSPAPTKPARFTVELTEDQALAYAQFLKRVCFSDYSGYSVDKDEAFLMMYAGERIREALASAEFSPR